MESMQNLFQQESLNSYFTVEKLKEVKGEVVEPEGFEPSSR